MDGPFTMTRNKWQITPLERIEKSIEEVKGEIQIAESEKNLEYIRDLAKTIKALEEEKANRKERVRKIKTKRNELVNQLSRLRDKKFSWERNNKMEKVWKEISEIDKELGPFRNYDQPIYLG